MYIYTESFAPFRGAIKLLPGGRELQKSDLLTDHFRLYEDDRLAIFYVPFDYVKPKAKLTLVGITPGWTQMERAFRIASKGLRAGHILEQIFFEVDCTASFAGSMRTNLINILDGLGVGSALGLKTSELLFAEHSALMHTTSAIRYATFIKRRGKLCNYTGYSPKILKHAQLRAYVENLLTDELERAAESLIVPLGKAVSEVLEFLVQTGRVDPARCLIGFPHPSGANGHRRLQFQQGKAQMASIVDEWFDGE